MTELKVGALVLDTRRDLIGEVMDAVGGRVILRAPGGGREWEALPCDIRPATSTDALSAKVADANERSTQGPLAPPRPRCATCADIRRRRHKALEADDRDEAARLTTVMGRHQREAHSE
ncbi:hypothetical protein ACFY2W_31800 [Streptomyces sp. NPDC001262]|uniref:hypothetical protein n=1 Tax=unclassified Streptomyces TaxID=2593676 RepID=UPI0036D09F4D